GIRDDVVTGVQTCALPISWPPPDMRQDMLEEAIQVIRELHRGGERSHYGRFFTVHDARVYNLPDEPIPIYVAAAGEDAAKLAGQIGRAPWREGGGQCELEI